jgi:hypothetical protein
MRALTEFRWRATVMIGECHKNQYMMKYSKYESETK